MLAHTSSGHFAHKHYPEKERRLCWFSNTADDDQQAENENAESSPETLEEAADLYAKKIEDQKEATRKRLIESAPLTFLDRDLDHGETLSSFDGTFDAVIAYEAFETVFKRSGELQSAVRKAGIEPREDVSDQIIRIDKLVRNWQQLRLGYENEAAFAKEYREKLKLEGLTLSEETEIKEFVSTWIKQRQEITQAFLRDVNETELISVIRAMDETGKEQERNMRMIENLLKSGLFQNLETGESVKNFEKELNLGEKSKRLHILVKVLQSDHPSKTLEQYAEILETEDDSGAADELRTELPKLLDSLGITIPDINNGEQETDYAERVRIGNTIDSFFSATRNKDIAGSVEGLTTVQDESAERERRGRQIRNLHLSSLTLREYLDAKLHKEAWSLLEPIKEKMRRDSEADGGNPYSMPAKDYYDAADQNTKIIRKVLRTNQDPEDNNDEIEEDGYLSDAEHAVKRLRALRESDGDSLENSFAEHEDKHKDAIADAAIIARNLREAVSALRTNPERWKDVEEAFRHEDADIFGFAGNLQRLEELAGRLESLGAGTASDADREWFYDEATRTTREGIRTLCATVKSSERLHSQTGEAAAELRKESLKPKSPEALTQRLAIIENRYFPGEGGQIAEAFRNPVCNALGMPKEFRKMISSLRTDLKLHASRAPRTNRSIEVIAVMIQKLDDCFSTGQQLQFDPTTGLGPRVEEVSAERLKKITKSSKTVGGYKASKGVIYVLEGITDEQRLRIVRHETIHAWTDLLTRKSGLFLGMLVALGQNLEHSIPDDGSGMDFNTLLTRVGAQKWNIETQRERVKEELEEEDISEPELSDRIEEEMQDMRMDELLARYCDHKSGEGNPTEDEKRLFKAIEGHVHTEDPELSKQWDEAANEDEKGRVASLTADDFAEMGEGDDGSGLPSAEDAPDINQQRRDTERDLRFLKEFYTSYPQYKSKIQPVYDKLNDGYENYIIKPYKNPPQAARTDPAAKIAHDLQISRKLTDFNDKYLGPLAAELKELKIKKLDLSEEKMDGKKGLRAITDQFNMISVFDLIGVVKTSMEDIKRLYERRAAAKQAKFGQAVTSNISDRIPYGGHLKHEFKRRDHESELNEVNQWKEALKDLDAYEMLEMLGTSRNKDQVRALLELLQESGRMDWNDEGFWDTLNALSRYSMPKEACRGDDVLRDKWLNKLITDIYDDKDHFNNWRKGNDSAIESGKSEFTPVADQLANVEGGGLGNRLYEMLKTYVEAKEAGKSIPEDVNPHQYEEIIHYSIRNGKMTMEQKFYYLIQGVRYGLLSIDRIRTLAGEKGGVLLEFPFMDYFYQKNNTLEDLTRLGERLDEAKTGEKRFKPGIRTTLFTFLEISRERAVKERLRKGLSRVAEKMDHDDMHYFLTNIDYGRIEEMLDTWSGNRQKMTNEGLKNGYVGFNMKLRVFAGLAELDDRGLERFSQADARDIAQTIASYMHFDNILTNNGVDKATRPKLTRFDFSETPVVGNERVKEYRQQMSGFVDQLFEAYGSQINWGEINRKLGASGDSQVSAQTYALSKDINSVTNDAVRKNNFAATKFVVDQLEDALVKNPQLLMEILKKNKDQFIPVANEALSFDEMMKVYEKK